jgi:hypothetical protein
MKTLPRRTYGVWVELLNNASSGAKLPESDQAEMDMKVTAVR